MAAEGVTERPDSAQGMVLLLHIMAVLVSKGFKGNCSRRQSDQVLVHLQAHLWS